MEFVLIACLFIILPPSHSNFRPKETAPSFSSIGQHRLGRATLPLSPQSLRKVIDTRIKMLMLFVFLAGVGILFFFQWKKSSYDLKLPPGPKPLPIVGNILDLPPRNGDAEYKYWLNYKDAYGPISRATVFGQHFIILHDRKATNDLLVRTSSKTSGRPYVPFAEMCGYTLLLNLLQYDDTFRLHRKFVHQQFGTKSIVSRFHDVLDMESHRFLFRILEDPAELVEHIKA